MPTIPRPPEPYYTDSTITLFHGDCLDVLRSLPDASVDAVCTDPPYGLEFMGKDWDSFGDVRRANRGGMPNFLNENGSPKFNLKAPAFDLTARGRSAFQEWCQLWSAECLRVLKPGGHMLAFGGTRTWHLLACGIEEAGGELRDSIAWLYSTGFPKHRAMLKPAFEPIVVARRPVATTVAANLACNGLGELQIARVRGAEARWPSNVVLDASQAEALISQAGESARFFHVAKADASERVRVPRKLLRLRSDLTPEQVDHVTARLREAGVPGA